MKISTDIKNTRVGTGSLAYNILESGDIQSITKEHLQVNQFRGNLVDGTIANIYLRIKDTNEYYYTRLIGVNSPSRIAIVDNSVFYIGEFRSINYTLQLSVIDDTWFYDLNLFNKGNPVEIDVFYGQDVSLAGPGANEAYASHYIDHKAFKNEHGFVIRSKETQSQTTFFKIGSFNKTIGYATDGFQFFGLDYKFSNQPEALSAEQLPNIIYQYEFAYPTLQTETFDLVNEAKITFYGIFKSHEANDENSKAFEEEIKENYGKVKSIDEKFESIKINRKIDFDQTLNGEDLTAQEIDSMWSNRLHEENVDGELISFFDQNKNHVVLKAKEALVERPHGHIILNGDNNYIKENTIATTNFMCGIFNSQVVVGNTSFNKMISNVRNSLNVLKSSGQRILIKDNGIYKLLGVPSSYELGINFARWIYKFNDDVLTVLVYTKYHTPQIVMNVTSKNNNKYDFLIMNQMVLGVDEYAQNINFEVTNNKIKFSIDRDAFTYQKYPDLKFDFIVDKNFKVHTDEFIYADSIKRNEPFVFIEIANEESFEISINGRINNEEIPDDTSHFKEENDLFHDYYTKNLNNFELSIDSNKKEEISKFNTLAYWYNHNALIHYQSPHGLEQYGGAAWGTRDVCQGPFEYFLATQHFEVCKDILKRVYVHQFIDNGDWPQWFMFDKYNQIQASESHGDVIVWPLRSLALYLKATHDQSILEELLPYTKQGTFETTTKQEKLIDHVLMQLKSIKENFISNTSLSCYGDGDWDDTLQPANPELRKSMVSGWTTALTYETFDILGNILSEKYKGLGDEFKSLAESIKSDYRKYVIVDGVPAGFLLFEGENIKYIVHPLDDQTGVKYRLLPINRCLISGLFDKDEIEHYFGVIKEHLYHPDGVRLMDTTVKYNGGANTYFRRAEQSAYFGREVGLQYVHAHIRFIEAMAKVGYADEVWKGLLTINPINIQNVVPNADRSQSNCYFSSSDAAFNNRYEAMEQFEKIKTGDVRVKAGWRVYSSGPGIYLNQLISNALGIRIYRGKMEIDPVLPAELNGLNFKFGDYNYKYIITQNEGIKAIKLNGTQIKHQELDNKYRPGSALISIEDYKHLLTTDNIIEVVM